MDGPKGAATFDCHWRIMESWVGTENVVSCRCYNEPTLFRNIVDYWP